MNYFRKCGSWLKNLQPSTHFASCVSTHAHLVCEQPRSVWQLELVLCCGEMSHALFDFPTQVCTWVISHSGQKKFALLPALPAAEQCLVFIIWSQGLEHGSCKHIASKKACRPCMRDALWGFLIPGNEMHESSPGKSGPSGAAS